MSPKGFRSLANTDNKPWKAPLPQFIESLYEKKFGKTEPDHIRSIEEMASEHMAKRAERKAQKAALEAEEVVEDGDADSK